MYCKNCGSDQHFAADCPPGKRERAKQAAIKSAFEQGKAKAVTPVVTPVKENLTPVKQNLTASESVKKTLTPGEPCPTCGHKVRATAAQYQKAYRARKGKA